MKYLIAVVAVCSILLYSPFYIKSERQVSSYQYVQPDNQVTYIEGHTKSLDKLLEGDLIVFGAETNHSGMAAIVGKQKSGVMRGLKMIPDSLLTQRKGIDLVWAKKMIDHENIPFVTTDQLIHPDVTLKLLSSEILVVYRKVETNFYYRPIFEGILGILLFFIFFFGISIIHSLSLIWSRLVGILMALGLFVYFSSFRYDSDFKHVMGDWNVRMIYLGISMFLILLVLYIVYRYTKQIKNQYCAEALKFATTCLVAPLSIFVSFKVYESFYPELTLLPLYKNGNLDQLTIWTHYYYGYAFALASLLAFGIRRYKTIKLEKEAAVAGQLTTNAQLNSLQARLNPHFLYNALNSIASLISTHPDKAEEMTLSVSKFLKHFSNREADHLISVQEEVDMVVAYLEIEKIRFGNKLAYDIDVSEEAKTKLIARAILQPLVENAIKYGFDKDSQRIKIELNIDLIDRNLSIILYDSGLPWDANLSKGYGLSSVYDKLKLLYSSHYEISFINEPRKHIAISLELDKLQVND